jgi:ankyrin repeat protein
MTRAAATAIAVLFLALGAAPARLVPAAESAAAPAAPPKPTYYNTTFLHDIEAGNLDAVKRHLAGKDPINDINFVDGNGATLLHHAASAGRKEIALYLLDHGADINAGHKDGPGGEDDGTPIHSAAVMGKTEMVRFLKSRGAIASDAPTAAAAGDADRLRQLVKDHPDFIEKTWYNWGQFCGEMPLLHHAAMHGSAESIAALVALGADAKAADSDGTTALVVAAAGGHLEAVRELLKHDNRPGYVAKYGWTPLIWAAYGDHEPVVKLLLERGAEYDVFTAAMRGDLARVKELVSGDPTLVAKEVGSDTPLVWAARRNRADVVTYLLDEKSDINHADWSGSILAQTAWEGHIDIIRILLDRGANTETGAEVRECPYGTALHQAAHKGRIEIVRLLLDRGAKIDSLNNDRQTPLCFAVGEGHAAVAKLLLDRGADPNGKGRSPLGEAVWESHPDLVRMLLEHGAVSAMALHHAAERGDVDLVQLLLKHAVDKSLRDDENRTPLHVAVMCREAGRLPEYMKIVDLLIKEGYRLDETSSGGRKPIHLAANLPMLQHLLDCGADVDTRTTNNNVTPLYLASSYKDVDRVKFLLAHGADVNAADKDGGMPLHQVIGGDDERSKAITALLLEHGATVDAFAATQLGQTDKVLAMLDGKPDLARAIGRGGQTLLHLAAGRGNFALVQTLLDRKADLEAKDRWAEWTPLHHAACNGHADVVKFLLAHGAKVEAPGAYNQGILYTAVAGGHAEVVRLLLAAGADVEATTSWERFPLIEAAEKGNTEVIKLLLDAGAKVDRLCKGTTALDAAVSRGQEGAAKLLLSRGAEMRASKDDYSPPLHSAASAGRVGMVRILLDAGAEVNRLNERHETATDWAVGNGKTDAAKVLRAAGGLTAHELFGPERIAALVRQLGSPTFADRQAADYALRLIAPHARQALEEALRKTDDPEPRERLRKILAEAPATP